MSTLAIDTIAPNPRNPRRIQGYLDDLVSSIRKHGVLQPILVRPRPASAAPLELRTYETVCGSRRLVAAERAGLHEIPAEVRTLTDEQAFEIALIENLQREDLHPLEEADAYQQLLTAPRPGKKSKRGDGVAELAARVGRSETYVRQRLALTGLGDKARAVFLAGDLTIGLALLVARLPDHEEQAAAAAMLQHLMAE